MIKKLCLSLFFAIIAVSTAQSTNYWQAFKNRAKSVSMALGYYLLGKKVLATSLRLALPTDIPATTGLEYMPDPFVFKYTLYFKDFAVPEEWDLKHASPDLAGKLEFAGPNKLIIKTARGMGKNPGILQFMTLGTPAVEHQISFELDKEDIEKAHIKIAEGKEFIVNRPERRNDDSLIAYLFSYFKPISEVTIISEKTVAETAEEEQKNQDSSSSSSSNDLPYSSTSGTRKEFRGSYTLERLTFSTEDFPCKILSINSKPHVFFDKGITLKDGSYLLRFQNELGYLFDFRRLGDTGYIRSYHGAEKECMIDKNSSNELVRYLFELTDNEAQK